MKQWAPVHAVKRIDVCNGGVQEVPTTIPGIEQLFLGLVERIHSVTAMKLLDEFSNSHAG